MWDALRRTQMAAPTAGATPRESRAPSRAPSANGTNDDEEGSDATITEADERFIVKSLEMVVTEGGKNFSAGELSHFSSSPAFPLCSFNPNNDLTE